ncbi:Bestrophin [Oesophagostomum dentatum]|uniref:Bestrophin homolog n=1 Tax=Oesophagostomum dentatum TaxID=61180 RepID=A0A0B1TD38_OESDE|nr:Bestrophin [Oesophagostomum dentatum]
MTISYNLDVSSVSPLSFFKLLLRWRGSIWKSVKSEFIVWTVSYYIVFIIYRYALPPSHQRVFEKVAYHCNSKLGCIPLTFLLAFFVNIIADRWRKIFNNMGFMMDKELELLESVKLSNNFNNRHLCRNTFRYWVPVNWALTIVGRAYQKKYINNAPAVNLMIKEVNDFRTGLAMLCNYDWVPIPIAYPQVVFLAVRSYFIICVISRQYLIGDGAPSHATVLLLMRKIRILVLFQIDMYVPFMTMLQFLFFVAWMKVAEALLNPLGEDDDDFECNFLIDRNISIGMAIVDQTADNYPTMKKDKLSPEVLMHLNHEKDHELVGSAAGVE